MDYFNEQLNKYEYKLLKERESRREALADMIRMAEEAGLYEAEAELYETIDVGEVDWNKTAIQNMELNRQKTEAINRVRELHKEVDANDSVCGDSDCCGEYIEDWTMCADCWSDYPCPTIKALDSE
jgi:hypothetical protein